MALQSIDDVADLINSKCTAPIGVGGDADTTLPPHAIKDLLRICFFASLRREEGRPTEFDLALFSKKNAVNSVFRFNPYTHVYTVKTFEEARQLTISELVRVAPACNPDKTVLLANWNGIESRLALWGLADTGWEPSIIDPKLGVMRIRVTGPAEMTITLMGNTLCLYKDGAITVPQTGLINRGAIYDFFKPTSFDIVREVAENTHHITLPDPIPERHEIAFGYLRTIQELTERLQRLKHGGCFLIIPETESEGIWNILTAKYRCVDAAVWRQLVGQWILHYHRYDLPADASKEDSLTAVSQLEDVQAGLRDSLEALVRLTAVDGAVLITRKLELLGFGCVVRLREKADYKLFRCEDRTCTKTYPVAPDSFGTRHRSAFEFCYRCNPSVAIVVSHDGGTKFITRRGADVFFWENSSFNVFGERAPFD